MVGWAEHIFLFSVGFFAGILNVTAGGGSFLTLPVLIFLGLPAAEANGTNRVGIFLQNIGAVWSFHRHGIVEWYWMKWAMGPGLLGCVIGAWLALTVGEEAFQKILAILMFGVIIWTFWDPLGNIAPLRTVNTSVQFWVISVGFFGIGLYAGFLQAGVGFFILGLAVAVGLDFVRGNALKVLSVLIFTSLALVIFAWYGRIDWLLGATLGAGTMLGGVIGVKLTVIKGHAWLKRIVTVTMILCAVKLWVGQ